MKTESIRLNSEELKVLITSLQVMSQREQKRIKSSVSVERLYNRLYTVWEELTTLEKILNPTV